MDQNFFFVLYPCRRHPVLIKDSCEGSCPPPSMLTACTLPAAMGDEPGDSQGRDMIISAFFFSKLAGLSDWRENVLHILAFYSEPFMEGSPSLQTLLGLCKVLLW